MEGSPWRLWILWAGLVAMGLGLALPLGLGAGPREMTTADRLAILYTPQFNFTRDGEPLIHVGVLDGASSTEFSSDSPMRVMPLGDDGPELVVDGRKRLRIEMEGGEPGSYRHWVVVERLRYGQKDALEKAIDQWVARGYLPTAHEVGGLFAVGGRRFDSRVVLLGVGGFEDRADARELAERLSARFGIETEQHTELLSHASGTLRLTGMGGTMIHKDVIWVGPTTPDQVFTLKTGKGERRFKGGLVFTADRQGMLAVINAVPAETLVKGVVPSEVYTSAPMESLKAQAVAARGTMLSYLGVRHLADPFKLCSDVHCQVYTGLSNEHPRTNEAVEQTRGEVMFEARSLNGDWRIVDARYSSNCGGHSEHNDLVWGGEAHNYLRGHLDTAPSKAAAFSRGISDKNIAQWLSEDIPAWCNTSRFSGNKTFRWKRSADIDLVQEKVDHHKNIGRLMGAEILERGVSGRIIRMRFVGESGTLELNRELAIRRVFGGLRSSMFTMVIERDSRGFPTRFDFKGGGFGHGAGMCQTGAMMMGDAGHNHHNILKHYYQDIALKKLY